MLEELVSLSRKTLNAVEDLQGDIADQPSALYRRLFPQERPRTSSQGGRTIFEELGKKISHTGLRALTPADLVIDTDEVPELPSNPDGLSSGKSPKENE